MARNHRPSSSFPTTFGSMWLHVANSGKKVTIDSLGDKSKYHTFRARMNEYRASYKREAEQEQDETKLTISKQMYGVAISEPYCEEGTWKCDVRPHSYDIAQAIEQYLPGDAAIDVAEAEEPHAGEDTLAQLFKGSSDDD